ncbi:peptidylprolyl isomerase fpr4 [Gaertneriomyces sp. JEL0708]|nr:peptidylprolyl isomerase fpr4 [Gaertneriomyces sp. JEL0708]
MSLVKTGVWGLLLEPGKTYSQTVDQSFGVTMAALGEKLPKDASRTSIKVNADDKSFVLCSLTPGKIEQQQLDLVCPVDEDVTFENVGNCVVYLTGNYLEFFPAGGEYEDESDDESDLDEDALMEMMAQDGESGSDEEDWEDASGDEDDLEDVTEELDLVTGKRKLPEIPSAKNAKKAKIVELDAMDVEEPKVNGKKDAKKDAKKEVKKDEKKKEAAPKKQEAPKEKETKKEKETRKADAALSAKAVAKQQPKTETPSTPTTPQKAAPATPSATKKTLKNGLVIEDVTVGTGPKAKRGKPVAVRYIGRLSNGKIFDQNIKGSPFTFRLGAGEVIKGWDLGVDGMAVGGARKLTIPAALAYGSRGAPPDIPPNATLTFEVKLLEVRK